MNITIRQVDAFLMVAELRSFTAAGAALHITQSAVSNLVKDLEDQIGVQLFDRGRRVVKLTAAGKIFFEKASRAQDVFRSMEQCATELHDARIHRVRIAAAPLLGCTLIPLLAYRFMRRYPEMRVELVDLPMSRVQQAVVDGIRKEWEGQNRPCLIRGVSGGAGVLIGNLLGADELEKAREYGGRLTHLAIAIGVVTGGLLMLISPAIVHFAPLTDTAAEYLQYMLLFCGLNLMAQSVNTTVLDGIFCAGGDAKFDMQGNIGAMWCFSVPLGFLAAFWLKLPVMVVYCIVNLDEIVKLPAVYLHYKKYVWVRNITRDIEE